MIDLQGMQIIYVFYMYIYKILTLGISPLSCYNFNYISRFTYLRTILTNQNSIHEGIKSGWKSENVVCHSVQNILSSSLL